MLSLIVNYNGNYKIMTFNFALNHKYMDNNP